MVALSGAKRANTALGFGSLQRQQSAIFQHFNRADVRKSSAQELLVNCFPAGIDGKDESIAAMGDRQIVDDTAMRVCKKRVTLPPSRKPDDIDRNKALERRRNIGHVSVAWPQRDLTHMRHVKQTCMGARVKVLLHNAKRILDWHFVAREGAHACTPRNVQIVKGRPLEHHGMLNGGRRSHRTTRSVSWNAHANETAPLNGCVPPEALVCEWLLGNGGIGHLHRIEPIVRCPLCIFA
jgi:hypothetical protein